MRTKSLQLIWLLIATIVTYACSTKQEMPSSTSSNTDVLTSTQLPKVAEKIPSTHVDHGSHFAVAAQNAGASKAAEEIYKSGGNIIDAAIAASFAISVERPQSTGIGGGGFLLYYDAKSRKTFAFDFREVAPRKAFSDMYLNSDGSLNSNLSKDGILAAGVPGLVAGLHEIHKLHGKLEWSRLVEPAIRLADQGFEVYDHLADAIEDRADILKKSPDARKIFFKKNGDALKTGDLLVQKDLAKTLRAIQERGRDGFYKGWVASALLNEFANHGGLLEKSDLDSYRMKIRQPVEGTYRAYKIASMPPPSSGGTHIVQILNILENANLYSTGPASYESVSLTTAAMQQAFADRAAYMGDSDFVKVPLKNLLSKSYARKIYNKISKSPRQVSEDVRAGEFPKESTETTHFSLMDAEGNAIASTQTINGWFGNGMIVPGTGIVLNNEMDDFAAKVGAANLYGAIGGTPNKIEAGKRPLSSMSPSIVFDPDSGRPILAVGSPSGTRIITCTLLSILNVLEYGMSLEDAQLSLRYHHQWKPDSIHVEAPGFPKELDQELRSLGFQIEEKNLGCSIQAIQQNDGRLTAVSDPRGQGRAIAE